MTDLSPDARATARALLDFIDASPSPWHAVATASRELDDAGFSCLREDSAWRLEPGGGYYVIRDESSLIAFRLGDDTAAGFRFVGAHTDSPGLRVKPSGAQASGGLLRLGVEVYGSPILATFTDRDLSLAGRVSLRGSGPLEVESRLVRFETPLVRIPNLAIHMNRTVNSDGLKLDPQTQLPPLLERVAEDLPEQNRLRSLLARRLGCDPRALLAWELHLYDTQPGSFFGPSDEFIANSQLDNLASCHAAVTALTTMQQPAHATAVCALFDHEEVGSVSAKGADGSFLADVVERIALARSVSRETHLRALAASFFISADMAHAHHPAYPDSYDSDNAPCVNGGPVVKINASQRYTSESVSEARFQRLCESVDTPCQRYVHRSNLPCGSTIGPMAAARLGVRTVDVGNPMWSMHSARESAGAADHAAMVRVLHAHFNS
ncbi:MAG: M18 family aminopeptidase [Pseudomonadota bacterium]|nr:M18 family aminopeptidase [Pseudomonadota bacterium]